MAGAGKSTGRVIRPSFKGDELFGGRSRSDLAFLPAALEIVETPPPPLPRITALAITGLLGCALTWASLSKVDIVSTATGQIIASGGGKVVQPLETGTVDAIRVHEGQHVSKGQVLIELEPTETLADQDRLKGELMAADIEVARLRAVALGAPYVAPSGADSTRSAMAAREAQAEIAQNAAKLADLNHQIEQHRAELAGSRAEEERLRTVLPIEIQQTQVFTTLEKKGYGSKLQLLGAQEKQQDTQQQLDVQRLKAPEIQAAIDGAGKARAEAAAEAAKTSLGAFTDSETKAASLAEELRKAEERVKGRTLTSPVSGAVQELAVHTVGGVVEPGQTLMRIAPESDAVEVEAKLENKDIGFVRTGMPAQVKVETFPFTRYGLIHAKVLSVSMDSLAEPPPSQQSAASQPASPTPPSPRYMVRLGLDRGWMDVDGRRVELTPGMVVTAEIMTGKRRVISFMLSPLAKAVREAGHER